MKKNKYPLYDHSGSAIKGTHRFNPFDTHSIRGIYFHIHTYILANGTKHKAQVDKHINTSITN